MKNIRGDESDMANPVFVEIGNLFFSHNIQKKNSTDWKLFKSIQNEFNLDIIKLN